jgi:hypothetical protein
MGLGRSLDQTRPLTILLVVFGVPYGNRTRAAAVKEKRFTGFKGNLRHG